MKVPFVSLLLLALAAPALALPPPPPPPRGIRCRSTGVADAGFNLFVRSDLRSANLSQISLGGPMPLARLECVRLFQTPGHPEQLRNFLLCRGFSQSLGELAVRLYSQGLMGLETASVRRVTTFHGRRFEKELRFGRLSCIREL